MSCIKANVRLGGAKLSVTVCDEAMRSIEGGGEISYAQYGNDILPGGITLHELKQIIGAENLITDDKLIRMKELGDEGKDPMTALRKGYLTNPDDQEGVMQVIDAEIARRAVGRERSDEGVGTGKRYEVASIEGRTPTDLGVQLSNQAVTAQAGTVAQM